MALDHTATPPPPRRLLALGSMRWFLAGAALLAIILRPAPGSPVVTEGWALVPLLMAPVMAPLVVTVLLLDALMARIFLADAEGALRGHYRLAILFNLLLAGVTSAYWLPYYLAIGG